MDRTQEILDYLLQKKERINSALQLIKETKEHEYDHALNWTGDVRRAAEYAIEHGYYEISAQFDINGEDRPKYLWFDNAPRFDLAYGSPSIDSADWEKIENFLYDSPVSQAIRNG